jgi:hypothetical protein
MTVKSSTGQVLGTVSRVERTASGAVRNVVVRTKDGAQRAMQLTPSSLSVSGDVVTVTDVGAGARS